ncbi:MAG: hypothetical protein HQL35_09490 [Alphaproteobacteria bacterium]|nr:hypothetical protein [Alphaproteobacteria bacterium]
MPKCKHDHAHPTYDWTHHRNQRQIYYAALAIFALSIFAPDVMAADDWVQPGIGFIDVLKGGLVQAGAALIGVGIIIFGTWGGLSGDMNWRRIGYSVLGGVFVMAGPKMLAALLESLQS